MNDQVHTTDCHYCGIEVESETLTPPGWSHPRICPDCDEVRQVKFTRERIIASKRSLESHIKKIEKAHALLAKESDIPYYRSRIKNDLKLYMKLRRSVRRRGK